MILYMLIFVQIRRVMLSFCEVVLIVRLKSGAPFSPHGAPPGQTAVLQKGFGNLSGQFVPPPLSSFHLNHSVQLYRSEVVAEGAEAH